MTEKTRTIADSTYNIQDVFTKQSVYPIIVSFQNGKLSDKISGFRGGFFTNASSKEEQKDVIIQFQNMLYVGSEKQDSVCRNLLLTRNRKTGKVRLMEAGTALLKALPDMEQKQNEVKSSQDVNDFTRNDLGEAFGSKRRKRMLEQAKKIKLDMDTMKDQLEKTINQSEISVTEMSEHNVDVNAALNQYAPMMNRDATDIKKVYEIENIIPEEQLSTLKEIAKRVLEEEDYEIEMSDYIAKRICTLRQDGNEEKIFICSLFLYVDCLIRYLTEPYKSVTNFNYTVCSYSELINSVILETFSARNDKGRTRPQSLKDKSLCYLMVVLLLGNNNLISDVNELAASLRTPLNKLNQMSKVIGAHFVNDAKNASIILKLPLAQPPSARMKKGRN